MAALNSLIRARRVQWVLIAAAVLGLIIGLDTLALHLREDPLADVRAYYDAGARLNAGLPLYQQTATTDEPGFYRYPPLLAIAFRPLALLPFEAAALVWESCLIVACLLTFVRSGIRNRWTWIVAGWLAAPIAWSLAVGQAQVAVTFLVALGAPWAIALAGHLKVLPILVGVYWVGRGDRSALTRLLAWTVGLAVLSLALEPNGTIAFLTFSNLNQVGNIENRSLYATSPVLWAVSIAALAVLCLRHANGRAGWPLAVALSVFTTPRFFMYQASTLQSAVRGPDDEHPSGRHTPRAS
ncbi:MAG: DUF2029 domain-containing protein [Propionibacteriaceae bacterium]|nr:DUF2029 domain-containing protein [Propionibacteriaceae bacterium]